MNRRPLDRIGRSARSDAGFTLVEFLVALSLLAIVASSFSILYGILSGAALNVVPFAEQQGSVRNVVRVLEADLRSADPLVLVPSSFTADPSGITSSGSSGTKATDAVAMYEATDSFSPCRYASTTTTTTTLGGSSTTTTLGGSSTTTTQPPVPAVLLTGTTTANVVWAFNPATRTLTRYSYCTSGASSAWTAGLTLPNVQDASGTMFQVAQDQSTSAQIQTPSPTTVPNQAAPVCGTSITVAISVKTKAEQTPFQARVVVQLPNQPGVRAEACA